MEEIVEKDSQVNEESTETKNDEIENDEKEKHSLQEQSGESDAKKLGNEADLSGNKSLNGSDNKPKILDITVIQVSQHEVPTPSEAENMENTNPSEKAEIKISAEKVPDQQPEISKSPVTVDCEELSLLDEIQIIAEDKELDKENSTDNDIEIKENSEEKSQENTDQIESNNISLTQNSIPMEVNTFGNENSKEAEIIDVDLEDDSNEKEQTTHSSKNENNEAPKNSNNEDIPKDQPNSSMEVEKSFNEIQAFIDLVETGEYDNLVEKTSQHALAKDESKEPKNAVSKIFKSPIKKPVMEVIKTADFIEVLSDDDDDEEPTETSVVEPEKQTSFLRVHDIPFKEKNQNETDSFTEQASLNEHNMNISKIDESAQDETLMVIEVPLSNNDNKSEEILSIDDDEEQKFSEEKNPKETKDLENEIDSESKNDDVVLVTKEVPVFVIDSDSDNESSKPMEIQEDGNSNKDEVPSKLLQDLIENPPKVTTEPIVGNFGRHLPPIAVQNVEGLKTDFKVEKHKPVKTKLVIQRNLGDVILDQEEMKRLKRERMKEFMRLKDKERAYNSQKFRKKSPTSNEKPAKKDLLLNPFAIIPKFDSVKKPPSRTSKSKSPLSYDLTDDDAVISSNEIEKNLSKIRDSVTATKRSTTSLPTSNHFPTNTNKPERKRSRFSSPTLPSTSQEPPSKSSTISVFDIINDVSKDMRRNRPSEPSHRRESPPRLNRNERFGDARMGRSSRERKRSPSPRTEFKMTANRIERNIRQQKQANSDSRRDVDFREMRFSVKNDLSLEERERMREHLERERMDEERSRRGSIFKRLGSSTRDHAPPSPPRSAFREDFDHRHHPSEFPGRREFYPRDFPVRDERDEFMDRNRRFDSDYRREYSRHSPEMRDFPDRRNDFPTRRFDRSPERDDFNYRNRFSREHDFHPRNRSRSPRDFDRRDIGNMNNFSLQRRFPSNSPPRRFSIPRDDDMVQQNINRFERPGDMVPQNINRFEDNRRYGYGDIGNQNINRFEDNRTPVENLNRFDDNRRNNFEDRGSMFKVSNPRNIENFEMTPNMLQSSSPRMVPPPADFDLDERSNPNKPSIFKRLNSANVSFTSDASGGYWQQGGAPNQRTPSPPPPPIYNPEDILTSRSQSVSPQIPNFNNVGQNMQPFDWDRSNTVQQFEEEDYLIIVYCEDERQFLTPQNCSQILDHLEMLINFKFNSTAYKDECLFIQTSKSKGDWIIKVLKSCNINFCPKLTAEVCIGALPSSDSYQVSVKIVSSLMNNPLKASNFFYVYELMNNIIGQHPNWSQAINKNRVTFYKNSINIFCDQNLDLAKSLKDVLSTIRVETNMCPKLAIYIDGDFVDMTMVLDAQLKKVGVIMNAIRSVYPQFNVNSWIISSINFASGLFHLKVPVRDVTLLCKQKLVLNIKWQQNCRGRLVFEFIDQRIERRILKNMKN